MAQIVTHVLCPGVQIARGQEIRKWQQIGGKRTNKRDEMAKMREIAAGMRKQN